jgi:DNA-binding CsgD family transcriptional regulator
MQEHALRETIAAFYAAAMHPGQWEDAFARFAHMCRAEVAGMHLELRQGASLSRDHVQQRWHGLDPAFQSAYKHHYLSDDPWRRRLHTMETGTVCAGEELVPRRALERSAFYNELSLRFGLDDLLGGVLIHGDDELATLGLVGRRNMRFGEAHKHLVRRVLPHVARALAIGKRLLWSTDEDERPFIEERLRVAYPLTAAEARVAALIGCGLAPKEIATILGTSWNTVRAQLGRVFSKTNTRGQTKLALLVHALEVGTRPTAIARVEPTEAAHLEEVLRTRYRLTRAEVRVANHVSRGMSAKETAEGLGLRWNTVRSHLRQIYRKTRTSGRAELTRLVMQFVA